MSFGFGMMLPHLPQFSWWNHHRQYWSVLYYVFSVAANFLPTGLGIGKRANHVKVHRVVVPHCPSPLPKKWATSNACDPARHKKKGSAEEPVECFSAEVVVYRSFKSLSFQDKNLNSLPVLKKLDSALISALLDDGISFFYRVRELELCDQCAHVPTSLGRDIWFAVEMHHGSLNLQDAAVGTCSRAWFASCLWCQYVCASDTPWF